VACASALPTAHSGVRVEIVEHAVAVVQVGDGNGFLKDARQLRVLASKLLLQRHESRWVGESKNHETKGVLAAASRAVVAVELGGKKHEGKQAAQISLAKAKHVPAKVVGEGVNVAVAVGWIDGTENGKGGDAQRRGVERKEGCGESQDVAERAWGEGGLHLGKSSYEGPDCGLLVALQSRQTHVAAPVGHLANCLAKSMHDIHCWAREWSRGQIAESGILQISVSVRATLWLESGWLPQTAKSARRGPEAAQNLATLSLDSSRNPNSPHSRNTQARFWLESGWSAARLCLDSSENAFRKHPNPGRTLP